MPLTHLGSTLGKRFGGAVGKQISDARVCDTFNQVVSAWWGAEYLQNARAAFVRGNTLVVSVRHSRYAHEIKVREADVFHELAQRLGAINLKAVTFQVMTEDEHAFE